MDPALTRNVSLETNDQGTADAQLALLARRLINKLGIVVINPDDLAATATTLLAALNSSAIVSGKTAAIFDASLLPTADPAVAGRVWRNAGVLTVSAG